MINARAHCVQDFKPPGHHNIQTNRRLSSFHMIALSTFMFLGFTIVTSEGRQCETYRGCLGDYRECCSGYCRRSCNLTCSGDEHCGSPGSIEEYCCKGKCISTSTLCEKPVPEEENVLSSPVIAVVAIFGAMLLVALCCVLRAHMCKFRALCFGEMSSQQQRETGSKLRGGTGFVELGRGSIGTEESLNTTERFSVRSNSVSTWVGQDFRIVPPKSSSSRNGHM